MQWSSETGHGIRGKANNLESYAYVLHILNHIGPADTLEKTEALLPWNVLQGITQK